MGTVVVPTRGTDGPGEVLVKVRGGTEAYLADAERTKIQAEAAASHNRVALDRMLIDQLPQIVREAAAGLANANINVLNGADGLGELAAGLVAQGLTIFDAIKRDLAGGGESASARGALTAEAAESNGSLEAQESAAQSDGGDSGPTV